MWLITLVLLALFIIYTIKCLQKLLKIYIWRKTLKLDKHYTIYKKITSGIDGFSLSRASRAKEDAFEYVYGEIEFTSFIALLSLTKPNTQTVFYDLGSGSGKAVIAAALIFPIKKSCGIELFTSLHAASIQQKNRLALLPDYYQKSTKIEFIQSNFLTANFLDATLIFINATGFFGDTWEALNQKLGNHPNGLIVITTTKPLSNPLFRISSITSVQMSWGIVKAYIQEK